MSYAESTDEMQRIFNKRIITYVCTKHVNIYIRYDDNETEKILKIIITFLDSSSINYDTSCHT